MDGENKYATTRLYKMHKGMKGTSDKKSIDINHPATNCTLTILSGLLGMLFLISGIPSTGFSQEADSRKLVEIIHTDFIRSKQHNGKTINRLIGNVQLMHNGAIMSCDSAYQFSSSEFEAYSRILIIKDDTKLYGDILNYDGNTNIAKVRGNRVRLTDDTATLRTQYLDFNTKENIGHFFNGGTIDNKDNLLESNQGYYYSNEKLFVFSDSVEIRNETYEIRCQSGKYNTRTDLATFTGHTSIWHKDGFLSCDYGWYDRPKDYFHFSKNAYILSEEQEMWADSIYYERSAGKGDLYGNVQMLDTVQTMIAFGNEAHFFEQPRQITLTKDPSVAYYSMEDNKPDTLFIRADTLRFITEPHPAFLTQGASLQDDTLTPGFSAKEMLNESDSMPSRMAIPVGENHANIDTIAPDIDSISVINCSDTLLLPTDERLPEALPVIPELAQVEENETLLQETVEADIDSTSITNCSDTLLLPTDEELIEAPPVIPELAQVEENETLLQETVETDIDSTMNVHKIHMVDTLLSPSVADSTATIATDSTIRKLYAYFNVRAFRQDIQAMCDSFAYSTFDSLGRMFERPALWNEGQQITANEIHFLTNQRNIVRADFLESAFLVTHEQDSSYNQIKGRDIIAFFRDNDIYLMDVIGGVQTIYYLQEDSVVANGNLATSTTMQIEIKKRKIQRIKYSDNPVIDTYPLEQLPADKVPLKGFEWREAERPKTRWEICRETPRPSQRNAVNKLVKPTFPITDRINRIK